MSENRTYFWIVFFYSVGLVVTMAVITYFLWDKKDPRIMYVPVPILQWSFVGGVAGVLYRLAFRGADASKDPNLFSWIVAKPVIGLFMGALIYFLAVSGELALNGKPQIANIQFLCAVAFLGGFSDRFSLETINRIVGGKEKDGAA